MKMFQQTFKQETQQQAQKWECHNWCNKGIKTKILQKNYEGKKYIMRHLKRRGKKANIAHYGNMTTHSKETNAGI